MFIIMLPYRYIFIKTVVNIVKFVYISMVSMVVVGRFNALFLVCVGFQGHPVNTGV